MRILVTGSAGFIGTAVLSEIWRRGHSIETFDRPNEIRDPEQVAAAVTGCDAVIHLAGVLGTHELFDTVHTAIDVNIHGTVNVLDACVTAGARYVGITMPPVFPSVYTATKVAATRLASAYHHTHGLPVSHVRAFNAFGPGQAHGPGHPQKIVPTFAVNAWAGRALPVWGDGTQTVDLIHTTDLARLLVDAVGHGDDVTFDGGTGHAMSVNVVAEFIKSYTDKPSTPIEYLPMRRGEEPTHIVATGQGWDRLDWRPEFRLPDLIQTVYSYRTHELAVAA